MARITVDTSALILEGLGVTSPCRIGKSGAAPAAEKREGDGKTPLGIYPLRTLLVRDDRTPPPRTKLPWRRLHPDDGWSDAPEDPAYNRPIRHPHPFSAERLWREDGLYDLILVIGHNDSPPRPGHGSAIFVHCLGDENRATEGCVALPREALAALAEAATPGDLLEIR